MRARLKKLEAAHRALAAQHTALLELTRTLLPLLPISAASLEPAIWDAVHRCAAGTENMDLDYQNQVRRWIAILAYEATAGQQRPKLDQAGAAFPGSAI